MVVLVVMLVVLLVSLLLFVIPMVPHDSPQFSCTTRKSYENLEEVPRIWEGEGSRLPDFSDFLW